MLLHVRIRISEFYQNLKLVTVLNYEMCPKVFQNIPSILTYLTSKGNLLYVISAVIGNLVSRRYPVNLIPALKRKNPT